MRSLNIRVTVAVGVLVSLFLIIVSGFVATSSRDLFLVILGFAFGLVAVCLNDSLKVRRTNHS
ncbi:MAG: hypothetical protein GX552_16130 [Chloroflexi bacterium]|jgi:uncharacterized Tic20 family protein|nr:hypothetical protein [Chloroflexota bacterium]